jgi:hypothetical protein
MDRPHDSFVMRDNGHSLIIPHQYRLGEVALEQNSENVKLFIDEVCAPFKEWDNTSLYLFKKALGNNNNQWSSSMCKPAMEYIDY